MHLGFHVSKHQNMNGAQKHRGMVEALHEDMELLRNWGFQRKCAQIFVSGPQNFRETLDAAEKDKLRDYVIREDVTLVIHGSYVDNPWNRSAGSIHNIKQEMRIASRVHAAGVIIHLGASASSDANLSYVLRELSNLSADVKDAVTLWLEIHAARPSESTYETPEKIKRLFERIGAIDTNDLRIGLCVDTAHLFSCGMALDTYRSAEDWLSQLPNIPLMIHLNDSASILASGRDIHQELCKGNLWGSYDPDSGVLPVGASGLAAVLQWAETHELTVILERKYDGIEHDLALIHKMGH
jgi:endonuclease IV